MIDVTEMAKALGLSEQVVAEVLDGQESPEQIASRLGCPINHGIALVTLRADRAAQEAEPSEEVQVAAVEMALEAAVDVAAWIDAGGEVAAPEAVVVVEEDPVVDPVEVPADPEPVAEPVQEPLLEAEPVSDPAPADPVEAPLEEAPAEPSPEPVPEVVPDSPASETP